MDHLDNNILNKNDVIPLYQQVANKIKKQIEDGDILPGDKLKSEAEMISEFNVGRITIRNALQSLVKEGLLEKIQGKGTYCKLASVKKEQYNIEVLLNMKDPAFIPYYIRGISEVLSQNNSNFLISDTSDDNLILCSHLERIKNTGASGIIFQYSNSQMSENLRKRFLLCFEAFKKMGISIISIDGRFPSADVSSVTLDEFAGGHRAGEHFAAFGHKQTICLYDGKHDDARNRARGFCAASEFFGTNKPLCIDLTEKWEPLLIDAISSGYTGVFCTNDAAAISCYSIIRQSGKQIPDDISVIGFDDTYLATSCDPQLTSFQHPNQKMGVEAARILMDIIRSSNHPVFHQVFHPVMTIRNSCTKVPIK